MVAAFRPCCVVLSGFGFASLMLFWLTKAARRVPLVVFVHNEWPDASVAPGSLADRTARAARVICVIDPSLKVWVQGRWPDLADRIRVIPQALPRSTSPLRPPPASPRIIFCGRLSHEKGPDVALKAFADLVRRCPEAELTIAGDGDLRREMEDCVAQFGIGHAVRFLGWVAPDEVFRLLDASSFVVMPSRMEGFGLVALEAALRGRAVVASSVGGLQALVQHGKTGLLCRADDVSGFAAAMECLCRDPARATLLGEAAAASAAQRPDWDSHVELAWQVLREACTQHPPRSGFSDEIWDSPGP